MILKARLETLGVALSLLFGLASCNFQSLNSSTSFGGSAGVSGSSAASSSSCQFGSTTLSDGSSASGFSAGYVPYGSTCASVAATVSCIGGSLNPPLAVPSCAVAPQGSCAFGNSVVANGATVTGYSAANVPYGSSCAAVSESVSCANGVLTPSNSFYACTPLSPPIPIASSSDLGKPTTVPNGSFQLESDLDMTGVKVTPIGFHSDPLAAGFTGTFDGQNHTISNLTVTGSGICGLFYSLDSAAVIKNVNFNNLTLNCSTSGQNAQHLYGALAALVGPQATISNVGFSGNLTINITDTATNSISLIGSFVGVIYAGASISGTWSITTGQVNANIAGGEIGEGDYFVSGSESFPSLTINNGNLGVNAPNVGLAIGSIPTGFSDASGFQN